MSFKVDNAIIMAAGTSSRFAPLSYELPKSLIEVKGEILIERQIRQIQEAGIKQIIVVVGYMKEKFDYLADKYGVILVENSEFDTRNNTGSINAVKEYLRNSYLCSSDNYFHENPFETEVDESYYSAVYSDGPTNEWCIHVDENDYIDDFTVGGADSWYMLGHTFWSEQYSKIFLELLEKEYDLPETADNLWETFYKKHIDVLKMKIRRYPDNYIYEFDTMDELREFDDSYVDNTRSVILKNICRKLNCVERDIHDIKAVKDGIDAIGFEFIANGKKYRYLYKTEKLEELVIC